MSGGTLGGTGTIGGAVTVNNSGVLAPGTSPGTLAISNNLTLNPGSVLRFQLGASSDKVVVSGNLVLGGTLIVTDSGAFANATYTLFMYSGTLSGPLPAVGSLPSGYVGWISTNTPGQVNLIVQFPPPTISNVSVINGNLVLRGIGPTNAACYVLDSTNLLLPREQWIRRATNQFDPSGLFAFTNSLDPSTPRLFFMLQLP
jgi:hypothetical protein